MQYSSLTAKGLITFLVAYFIVPGASVRFEPPQSKTAGAHPTASSITLAWLPFPAGARAWTWATPPTCRTGAQTDTGGV